MNRALLIAVVVLGAGAAAQAGTGDLSCVGCEGLIHSGTGSSTGWAFSSPLRAYGSQFTKPDANAGTTSPLAVVTPLTVRDKTFHAAIDASKADLKTPDVIRFDFSGQGKFGDASLPLKEQKMQGEGFSATFGPKVFEVKLQDKPVPVTVAGMYRKYPEGGLRFVTMSLYVCVGGTCAFGEKTCPVRILDGDGNLKFGDAVRLVRGAQARPGTGDLLFVDTGDGSFRKDVVRAYCGQPVCVNGAWYEVTVSDDGSKVAAKPVKVETGQIRIDHPSWEAVLIGKKHLLSLTGGTKPVDVPADEYALLNYYEQGPADSAGDRPMVVCWNNEAYSGKGRTVEVAAGKTAELAIGSPLQATLDANQDKQQVTFSFKLADATGAPVLYVTKGDGEPVDPPKLEVFDSQQKSVYSGSMEYG
jgi:hypothetical protein